MPANKTLFLVPSLTRAGAEKQVVDLVNGLSLKGVPCHLSSFETNRDQLDRVDLNAVVYHQLSRNKKLDWGLVRSLARIIDTEKIDVLHCTLSIAIFYGALAILFSKTKPALIAGVHTTISRTRKDESIERWVYRWIYRYAARVVFVCHRQKEHWLARDSFLTKNSEVIYNGVDPDHFSEHHAKDAGEALRKQLNIPQEAPVFCCIAAFRPEKAQGNIVQSLASLSEKYPDAHAVFAGEGGEKARVEKIVQELGLAERVHFLGNIPDVRPVLATSTFSVIASTAVETFSFAMLESMSMGTPVLSSRIGGADEAVIPGKTGYLVEPGNIGELTQAMEDFLGNMTNSRQLGENSREMVEQIFSMDTMIERTTALINNTVTKQTQS